LLALNSSEVIGGLYSSRSEAARISESSRLSSLIEVSLYWQLPYPIAGLSRLAAKSCSRFPASSD